MGSYATERTNHRAKCITDSLLREYNKSLSQPERGWWYGTVQLGPE
jgi:hypothetical protein